MLFLTLISLYTVRILFNILGVSDYGLYNVVGGFVGLFGCVSGTLMHASQRYYSYYLANNDWTKISKFFSTNMVIMCVISLVVFLICETLGLWFISSRLNIDIDRIYAAKWVYQFSVFTFIFGVLIIPFESLIISSEHFGIFAYISIFEGIFKLFVVFLLYVSKFDNLIFYSFLQFCIRISIDLFYFFYVKILYKKIEFILVKDVSFYRSVVSFVSWNFIGSIAYVFKMHGINIILNIFFGTVVNAARTISYQISIIMSSLADGFMKAVEPQIVKSYAINDYQKTSTLIFSGSKLSFFFIYVIFIAFFFNADYLLTLWLKNIPDYTVIFSVLVLIDLMLGALSEPLASAIYATGHIKKYQIVVGGLSLLNLPLSYLMLFLFRNPVLPFVIGCFLSFCMTLSRYYFAKKILNVNALSFIRNVIIPLLLFVISSFFLCKIATFETVNFIRFVQNVIISLIIVFFCMFFIGLSKKEKVFVGSMLVSFFKIIVKKCIK